LWEHTLAEPDPHTFHERVEGQQITDIGRRGKYLLLELSEDVLAIHLRMSGDLWLEAGDASVGVHYRLMLYLDDGSRLVFNDTRKFGRVWLSRDLNELLGHLGPEPLAEDFRAQDLYVGLRKRGRQIKPLLMDQEFLAGMGNIYTDEALYLSGIHPQRKANSLSQEEVQRLWSAIREVLEVGIQRNGSSIDWVYRGGDFQNYFQVYQRTGESCYRCGAVIERIVVGQRGTHFCPVCQPIPAGEAN
jgi:formamidopyrimidine-DNA glycosylase